MRLVLRGETQRWEDRLRPDGSQWCAVTSCGRSSTCWGRPHWRPHAGTCAWRLCLHPLVWCPITTAVGVVLIFCNFRCWAVRGCCHCRIGREPLQWLRLLVVADRLKTSTTRSGVTKCSIALAGLQSMFQTLHAGFHRHQILLCQWSIGGCEGFRHLSELGHEVLQCCMLIRREPLGQIMVLRQKSDTLLVVLAM